jgi:hypothetical protein
MNNYKIFFLPSNAAVDSPELLTELKRYGVVEHAGKSEADNRQRINDMINWQDAQTNNVGIIVSLAPLAGRRHHTAVVGKGIYSTIQLDVNEELTTFFADKQAGVGGWRLAEVTGGPTLTTRNSDWKINYAEYEVEPPDNRYTLVDYFHDAIPPVTTPVAPSETERQFTDHDSPGEISPGAANHYLKNKP